MLFDWLVCVGCWVGLVLCWCYFDFFGCEVVVGCVGCVKVIVGLILVVVLVV